MSEDKKKVEPKNEPKVNEEGIKAQVTPRSYSLNLQIPYKYPINRPYGYAKEVSVGAIVGNTPHDFFQGYELGPSLANSGKGYIPCTLTPINANNVKLTMPDGKSLEFISTTGRINQVLTFIQTGEEPSEEFLNSLGFSKSLLYSQSKGFSIEGGMEGLKELVDSCLDPEDEDEDN